MRKILENKVLRFLTIAGGLYVLWISIYYLLIKEYTNWDFQLNYNIVEMSSWVMSLFGHPTHVEVESDMVLIVLDEALYWPVWVGDECNGFKLFSIFSIFIIAFPGKWKTKLWFIPLGILIVHLANILRVCGLLWIANYHYDYLDFNHLYTFTILVYGIIFLLWFWYAKKLSDYAKKA